MRRRTKESGDGDRLAAKVFAPRNPILIFSELETESGKNDQAGFLEIFKGVYRGIRNPKAHSLIHDLNEMKARQYLVMLSLLARRLEEAKVNPLN
ncbi:MAG: TIGR02391 family protein [Magnetovibrionaceae bacterium]